MIRVICFAFSLSFFALALSQCANPEKTKTKEGVLESLGKEKERFQKCGTKIKEDSGTAPEGKVILSWDIDETGYAQNAVIVENTTENDELAECLRDSLNFIDFPTNKLVKTYNVRFPFVFKR